MSSKIEVSRELAVVLADEHAPFQHLMAAKARLRDLIAAPVVERQLVGREKSADSLYLTMWPNDTLHECESGNPKWNACLKAIDAGYHTPPELAELQATIANLTTELKVTKQALESLKGERAEIERLKGGQGEPVAIVTSVISRKNKLFEIDILNNSSLTIGDKLYTSQPAPVSAVEMLSEIIDSGQLAGILLEDAIACLDKVKELSQ